MSTKLAESHSGQLCSIKILSINDEAVGVKSLAQYTSCTQSMSAWSSWYMAFLATMNWDIWPIMTSTAVYFTSSTKPLYAIFAALTVWTFFFNFTANIVQMNTTGPHQGQRRLNASVRSSRLCHHNIHNLLKCTASAKLPLVDIRTAHEILCCQTVADLCTHGKLSKGSNVT